MPRNMSFALTTDQVLNQTKTVTRRQGWGFLKPGALLQPVEKGMGLKKGEKAKKLGGLIRVVSAGWEPLCMIDSDELRREGFPDMTPAQFMVMYMNANKLKDAASDCNRIEFEYL